MFHDFPNFSIQMAILEHLARLVFVFFIVASQLSEENKSGHPYMAGPLSSPIDRQHNPPEEYL